MQHNQHHYTNQQYQQNQKRPLSAASKAGIAMLVVTGVLVLLTGLGGVAYVVLGVGNPSAEEVAATLREAKLATTCKVVKPAKISATAKERLDCKLVELPDEGVSVMTFETARDYEICVGQYQAFATFAGPHRYGNKSALVFVQANDGLSMKEGARLKKIIENL